MPALVIACDFDGTITERDTLNLLVREFGDGAVWDAMEPDVRAGRTSVEHAMQAEFATVRVSEADAVRWVREHAGIRAGFTECVAWARAHGHGFVVLSNGFGVLIRDVLGGLGLGDLPVHSHECAFTPEGSAIAWTERGEPCPLCSRPCKRHDLARVRGDARVVYVGDGISDLCVAQAADIIYARADLADYLKSRGVPFRPFRDFHQIVTDLSPPTDAA
ncbi:MAG: MtnX-like HAD-IB family phosphatase [Thermoleophilia bacterium]|nr:MtnX-like HAD-IB family phosphatase [Thermoleophilia bacterium]